MPDEPMTDEEHGSERTDANGKKPVDPSFATAATEGVRSEVSATTVGRMLGLATTNELKLLEGKIDLMSTRVYNLTVRMEKVMTALAGAPTGSDLERIDVQIAALRSLIKESLAAVGSKGDEEETGGTRKRLGAAIRTSPQPSKETPSTDGQDNGGDEN